MGKDTENKDKQSWCGRDDCYDRLPHTYHSRVAPPEGVKADQEKLRYDLLPPEPIEEMVAVLTFGAKKYSDDNWKRVPDGKKRYYAALMRHLEAWRMGETHDGESDLHHLGHALCCLTFLLWFEVKK